MRWRGFCYQDEIKALPRQIGYTGESQDGKLTRTLILRTRLITFRLGLFIRICGEIWTHKEKRKNCLVQMVSHGSLLVRKKSSKSAVRAFLALSEA
jgi:hypothetical protein